MDNEPGISPITNREDLSLKLQNLETVNQWVNSEQALQQNTFDFLLHVQQASLKGTDVVQGIRPAGVSARIISGEHIAYIAPETEIGELLAALSGKIDFFLSQPKVNAEALKIWASTLLIGIHPFRDRNGASSRALMAVIDRKRGATQVRITDSSENIFKYQNAHESGLDMMTKVFLHKVYPDFRVPRSLLYTEGNTSRRVKVIEYLANQQGKTYDYIVKEMIRFSINDVDENTINENPIVKEADEISDTLRFDRSNIYREYKQQGIATYPTE